MNTGFLDTQTIKTYLNRIQKGKGKVGDADFVIFDADEGRNYYIQFSCGQDEMGLYAEAVGNYYLDNRFALTQEQIEHLKSLGWRSPEKDYDNFSREWEPLNEEDDLNTIADFVVRTFVEIYGIPPNHPIKIELGS